MAAMTTIHTFQSVKEVLWILCEVGAGTWDNPHTINSECVKSVPVAEQLYSSFPRHTATVSVRPLAVSHCKQETV